MSGRKTGTLIPLEVGILEIAAAQESVYGFALATELSGADSRALASHGTLYKALSRLTDSGLLLARWEQAELAESAGRPRRRLYSITAAGSAALTEAGTQPQPVSSPALRPAEA